VGKMILTATVTLHDGTKAHAKKVSVVTLRLGDSIVAGGTLGGVYTPVDVVREFKRLHTDKRFVKHAGYATFLEANAAGLIL